MVVVLALLVATGAVWFRRSLAPVGAGEARIIEIPQGAGSERITAILHEEGLIRSETAFRLALKQWGLAGALRAGHYELSPGMSAEEIARLIAEGRVVTLKVTLPEGLTLKQIGQRVAAAGFCSADEFLAAAVPATVADLDLPLAADSLEGFLFPDTYVLEYGTEPPEIVAAMASEFKQRVVEGMAADLAASRRPVAEIVTIASLIEKEARVEKDRPLIASVIYNRLRKSMALQIDATIIYALGEHKERLTYRDLKVKSPFNTYLHKGLPPHPIASPGEASIRAALRPARTDYLFYVAKPDGSHWFTKTYEEHQQAVRAIRKG